MIAFVKIEEREKKPRSVVCRFGKHKKDGLPAVGGPSFAAVGFGKD